MTVASWLLLLKFYGTLLFTLVSMSNGCDGGGVAVVEIELCISVGITPVTLLFSRRYARRYAWLYIERILSMQTSPTTEYIRRWSVSLDIRHELTELRAEKSETLVRNRVQ